MKKKKDFYDYIRQIRGTWMINPRTRVQDNIKMSKKKRRQEDKKIGKEEYEKE